MMLEEPVEAAQPPEGRRRNQARLIEAASALMVERNSIHVTSTDIARRAGLNGALVNYYFRNREGLLIELLRRDAAIVLGEMNSLLEQDIPPLEKLKRHTIGIVLTYYRYPYMDRLVDALIRDSSPESAQAIAELFARPMAQAQARLLREAEAAGQIRPVDPTSFSIALTGACQWLFAGRAIFAHVFDGLETDDRQVKRYARSTADLIVNGLIAPGATPVYFAAETRSDEV